MDLGRMNSDPNSAPISDPPASPKMGSEKKARISDTAFSDSFRSPRFEVDFESAPEIGNELEVDGLKFELIAVEPYQRKTDGQRSQLLTWRGHCADCSQPFTVKTGCRAKAINKRCQDHKARGRPASAAAQKRLDDSGITWAAYRRVGR